MKIEKWLEEVHGARENTGTTAERYPDAVILAFIDVESNGDPTAHRPGSQFYGLLQMGRLAGLDVGIDDISVLDGEDGDPFTEDDFEAFMRLSDRYFDRWEGDPVRLAVLWKGGAGTAAYVSERLRAGIDMNRAVHAAEHNKRIPSLREYVRRFRLALRKWAAWVDEQNAAYGVCANEVLDE